MYNKENVCRALYLRRFFRKKSLSTLLFLNLNRIAQTFYIVENKNYIVNFSILKGKNSQEEQVLEELLRQMDAQRAQMAIELEKLKNLGEKIKEIENKLREVERIIAAGGFKLNTKPVSSKTKEAIKMILQKYGELTPSQLSKLIKLSRTRCNEYLKEMEREGIAVSRIESRKKYYKLRQ